MTVDGILYRFVLERARRSSVPSVELTERVQMPEPSGRRFGQWERLCYATRGIDPVVFAAIHNRLTKWESHVLTTTGDDGRAVRAPRWIDPDLISAQMAGANLEAKPMGWNAIAREIGTTPRKLKRELERARALIRERMVDLGDLTG